MLADLWPLYGLALSSPRLRLRLAREEELAVLAELAGRGVHRPGERPFLTRWTEGTPLDRARHVLREHWEQLAGWQVNDWQLGLAVFHADRPIGIVTVSAHDFPVVREVKTWSWLGLEHQRQGFGTEARAALLGFAFDHLGAATATTGAFLDNHASLGVSRKLGYQPDGISIDARDGEAVVSQYLRLTRARWLAGDRPKVTVEGFDDKVTQMFTTSG